jgi:hypothetical protein
VVGVSEGSSLIERSRAERRRAAAQRTRWTTTRTVKKGVHGGNMVSPVLNQLLRIEEELGDQAVYPGWTAFPRARR